VSVALVTGSGGGLGAAIAARLTTDGYRVAGVDLSHSPDEAVERQYRYDLADLENLDALVGEVEDDLGEIRLLVNNAGYWKPTSFFDLRADQIQRNLTINVTAALLVCQAVARRMAQSGGGSIVNISSIAGRRGSSQVDYGASKAAVINFTTALARTLAGNIRINAVAPALVEAGMGTKLPP